MKQQDKWDAVMRLIDSLAPNMVSELLLAVEGYPSDWPEVAATFIERGDYTGLSAYLFPEDRSAMMAANLRLAVRDVYEELGPKVVAELRPLPSPLGPPVEFRFHPADERLTGIVQRQTTGLLATFSKQQQAGLKQFILAGINEGVAPAEIARRIQTAKLVGLSARGAQAVANYRLALEGGPIKTVLARALQSPLRDRRHDSTIETAIRNKQRLGAERVDAMTAKFSAKMLRHELTTLALGEVLQAHETVRLMAWKDTIQRGNLDPNQFVKRWYLAKDERTCPTCTAIASMNKNGVPIDGFFRTPSNIPLAGPLAHPRCRCITLIGPKNVLR